VIFVFYVVAFVCGREAERIGREEAQKAQGEGQGASRGSDFVLRFVRLFAAMLFLAG
jgi:hypothetical protein